MLYEVDAEDRYMRLAMACLKAIDGTRDGDPFVTISTTGPIPPTKGMPRTKLESVGSNGSYNYSVRADKLLEALIASGKVTLRRKEEADAARCEHE